MAKKKKIETEIESLVEKPKSYSVYLNKSMGADLDQIVMAETDGNVHAVLQFAVRYFIQEYKAGRVRLKKETVTKLKL